LPIRNSYAAVNMYHIPNASLDKATEPGISISSYLFLYTGMHALVVTVNSSRISRQVGARTRT